MKIDFYILESATTAQKAWLYACQLIEKAHAEQKQVFVHTTSKEDATRIDDLLWTYKEDTFIPHNLYQAADDFPPPIQIGFGENPKQKDTLINLSREIPGFYQQFNHVIEIVFSDPLVQQLARERYKQYRDQGFEINTYKIKS